MLYCRYIRDPLHATLRDILDDVIQLHNKLVGTSIFNESVEAVGETTSSRLVEVESFLDLFDLLLFGIILLFFLVY